MKRRWITAWALGAAIMLVPAAGAQIGEGAARTVVEAHGYASLDPVPRGRTFEAAVVAKVKPGFHINAHKVLDEFLIPTQVDAQTPAGFRVLATDYPSGELRQFSFSPKKMAVYTGEVVVKMKMEAEANAPLGAGELPFSLRYQACNDSMCLPPVTAPVSVRVTVAKAGSAAKAVHPEVFHR